MSTKRSPDVAEYPDSSKFGVLAEFVPGSDGKRRTFRFIGRERQGADYWEGE